MTTPVQVQRHRTAMVRHTLSQPVSLAVRHGLIREGVTVFDYGCGQGDDLRALTAAGITATGWDPHFAADRDIQAADVVNLGFVLNVIESPAERKAALHKAWSITRGVLVVSVMLVGAVPVGGLRQFGDGYLTSRGTFQRYFQHAEIRTFIAQATDVDPVALAPGIFAAFRSPEQEQEFLFERRRGRRASTAAYRSERPRRTVDRPELQERIAATVEAIAAFAVDRGRMPHPDEMPASVHDELGRERVSLARAFEVARATALGDDQISAAASRRQEDLLVHHALGILNRSRTASRLSPAMVRDIRALFGSRAVMGEQAFEFLHALADQHRTVAAMEESASAGLGVLDEDGRLVVLADHIEELSGILRCYIGCGLYVAGEVDGAHLVRLDPTRKRLTLFPLRQPRSAFPTIERSFTVDLRHQDVIVRNERRLLLRKSEIFRLSSRSKQRAAEDRMRAENAICVSKVLMRVA